MTSSPVAAHPELGYTERQLLTEILHELRALNGNIARLEEDLRPLLPFRFGTRRR